MSESLFKKKIVRGALAVSLGFAATACTTNSGEGAVAATPSASAEASYGVGVVPYGPTLSEEATSATPSDTTSGAEAPYLETVTDPEGALIASDPSASDGLVGSYDTGVQVLMLCKTENKTDKMSGDTLYEITTGPYDGDFAPAASFNEGVIDPLMPDCSVIDPAIAGD